MTVRTGQTVTPMFTTRNATTAIRVNADSLPAGTLYVNGVSNAAAVTVTNVATGLYSVSVTLPTLAVGDIVDINIVATVSSITDNGIIWSDTKDSALDSSGRPGIDWSNIGLPATAQALTGTTIATTQKVDVDTIKTNPVVNAGTVTFPTNSTLSSTINIAAGVITTVTTLTNLPAAPTDWLTADGISAGAVTKIQAGLSTYSGGDTSGTTLLLNRLTVLRSGYLDNLAAGAVSLASGVTVSAYSAGQDPATLVLLGIISGMTVANILKYIFATTAGLLPSGAGSGTESWKGPDDLTTVLTFTVDANGNRTAVIRV